MSDAGEGALAREGRRELLPAGYFHVVFTLAQELRVLALWNQEAIYDLMLKAAGAGSPNLASPKATD